MQKDFSFSFELPKIETDAIRQRSFSSDSHFNTKVDPLFKMSSSPISNNGSVSTATNTAAAAQTANRYKTELCRPFQEYGYCKYGDKCQFAHGFHDLRSLSRHPKYKTEYCRTFYSTGYCPYGTRCHFIHSKNESQPTQGSYPRPIMHIPPTSPSQDSGISSPDDTMSFLLGGSGGNGKTFDFPLALSDTSNDDNSDIMFPPFSDYLQHQSGGYNISSPIDPLINDDSLSSTSSNSPLKTTYFNESIDDANSNNFVTKVSSSISLDDGIFTSSSRTRLPVFDDMLNSQSVTSFDVGNY